MIIYKNNDINDDEIFVCQISIKELIEMNIAPYELNNDEIKIYLLNYIFEHAIEANIIDSKTLSENDAFIIEIEAKPENNAIDFHVIRKSETESITELLLENLINTLLNNDDENELDITKPDMTNFIESTGSITHDYNNYGHNQESKIKKVIIVVTYETIDEVIKTLKMMNDNSDICDINGNMLFVSNKHKNSRDYILHVQSTNEMYSYVIPFINEVSEPNDIKIYANESSTYKILKASHLEHMHEIKNIEELI